MSQYTTELRFICEMLAGKDANPDMTIEEVIEQSKFKLFDFACNEHNPTAPWLISSDKHIHDCGELFTKIIMHYYTREICEETFGLWKLRLKSRMLEIMPYYLQLYDTLNLKYDIYNDVDYTTSRDLSAGTQATGNATEVNTNSTVSNATQNTTSASTDYNLYSDTPQGALTNVDNETYLTNANKDMYNSQGNKTDQETVTANYNGNKNTSNNSNTRQNEIQHTSGKRGFQSRTKIINEYRKSILNIDKQVIDELSDLFFGLY